MEFSCYDEELLSDSDQLPMLVSTWVALYEILVNGKVNLNEKMFSFYTLYKIRHFLLLQVHKSIIILLLIIIDNKQWIFWAAKVLNASHSVDPDSICSCNADDMFLFIITTTDIIRSLHLRSPVDPRFWEQYSGSNVLRSTINIVDLH